MAWPPDVEGAFFHRQQAAISYARRLISRQPSPSDPATADPLDSDMHPCHFRVAVIYPAPLLVPVEHAHKAPSICPAGVGNQRDTPSNFFTINTLVPFFPASRLIG